MVFNTLWNIILGIIGGIISSVIVSRVFLIQGEYQQQVTNVEMIIRRIGILSGYLVATRSVFEVSYDQDIEMEKEMQAKGYKSEQEYYIAHKDRDWISKKDLLTIFLREMKKQGTTIQEDIHRIIVDDPGLKHVLDLTYEFVSSCTNIKELRFAEINKAERKRDEILKCYAECQKIGVKQLVKKILKDKTMIALFVVVSVIVVATIVAYFIGG